MRNIALEKFSHFNSKSYSYSELHLRRQHRPSTNNRIHHVTIVIHAIYRYPLTSCLYIILLIRFSTQFMHQYHLVGLRTHWHLIYCSFLCWPLLHQIQKWLMVILRAARLRQILGVHFIMFFFSRFLFHVLHILFFSSIFIYICLVHAVDRPSRM